MNEKILIVDDEKEIADLLEVYLQNDGYTVYKFYNGEDALQSIEQTVPDLAVLDVMLPGVDGFSLCRKIREHYYFPIIMLTAKIEDSDKIMGLTIGADDYITKPFNPLEVTARVKTQLRRCQKYNQPVDRSSEKTNTIFADCLSTGRATSAFCSEKNFLLRRSNFRYSGICANIKERWFRPRNCLKLSGKKNI